MTAALRTIDFKMTSHKKKHFLCYLLNTSFKDLNGEKTRMNLKYLPPIQLPRGIIKSMVMNYKEN